jgi:lipopolysaccharide export system permease protein
MRLLDRYLFRELLVPFACCLGGFLIFWISSDLFKEMGNFQEHKLRVGDIVEYYLVIAPEFLGLVMPVAFLLAVLYALTQHTRHNEITAIRAAGVSLWRLAAPYFIVGFVASVALLASNELWSPDSEERAEFIKNRRTSGTTKYEPHLVQNLGFVNTRDSRGWMIGMFNARTAEMTNAQVRWTLPDGSRRLILAARADWWSGMWVFHDVKEYTDPGGAGTELVPGLQTNTLPMLQFTETPDEIRSEIKISRAQALKNRHRSALPIIEILRYRRLHPQIRETDRCWLDTKLHSRLAGPWTCLVVVLIALPFGAASGRRNVFVGVAGSILICFAFFVLRDVGLAAGAAGKIPGWLAGWLPNLFFAATGAWLTARVR